MSGRHVLMIALTIVNVEGGYQYMAYTKMPNGGRIIASGEAMAQFFLGSADGVRLSGPGGAQGDTVIGRGTQPGATRDATSPTPSAAPPVNAGPGARGFALATRFWGKDSVPFMQDVVAWLLQ